MYSKNYINYIIKLLFNNFLVIYSQTFNCNSIIGDIHSIFNVPANITFNVKRLTDPIEEQITFYGISTGQTEFTIINKINFNQVFNLNYNTGFLIHGWVESFNGNLLDSNNKWMQDAAIAWISNANINVICVDWSPLAYYEYLLAATKNTKLVGTYVAKFIQDISVEHNIPLNSITIVGHSLGGQIAGYVGANLNGAVGFIIGLDPAGPCFTYPVDEGIENRLDSTDGIFVQVIHTACGSAGAQINCGDADFYANGGAMQPGCLLSDAIICSHWRSTKMFNSSIDPTHVFSGHQCLLRQTSCNVILSAGSIIPLIDTILQPIIQCTGTNDVFGLYTAKIPGTYQLITNGQYPYNK